MQKVIDFLAPRTRKQMVFYFFIWLAVINVYSLGVELFVGGGTMRGSVGHQLVALNLAAIPFLVLATALITHQYALQQKLTRLATTDILTGLRNRRGFLEAVSREGRFKSEGVLFLLDIDRFKSINDRYGHDVGDLTLEYVACCLKSVIRETDVISRHGGEEFAIFLPEALSEEIRSKAEGLVGPFLISLDAGGTIPVTLSGGVVPVAPETTVDHAMRAADLALYRAKEEGRARVKSHLGVTLVAVDPSEQQALAG